ncbi:hypothetical protein GCM10010398_69350 [Streptomyces fimbriatus]
MPSDACVWPRGRAAASHPEGAGSGGPNGGAVLRRMGVLRVLPLRLGGIFRAWSFGWGRRRDWAAIRAARSAVPPGGVGAGSATVSRALRASRVARRLSCRSFAQR